jgi:hypothetical protein
MYKKIIISGTFFLLFVAGSFLLFASKSNPSSPKTCLKECAEVKNISSASGFFIIDSFSGIL